MTALRYLQVVAVLALVSCDEEKEAQSPPGRHQTSRRPSKLASALASKKASPSEAPQKAQFAVLSASGQLTVGSRKIQLGSEGRLSCSSNGNRVVAATGSEVITFEVGAKDFSRHPLPDLALCASEAAPCIPRDLMLEADGSRVCLELSDGPPSLATGTASLVMKIGEAVSEGPCPLTRQRTPLSNCELLTAADPVSLGAPECEAAILSEGPGGDYVAVGVLDDCGDYCYQTVSIVHRREGRIVVSVPGVEVSVPVHWNSDSTQVTVGGVVLDLANPGVSVNLGAYACWLATQ